MLPAHTPSTQSYGVATTGPPPPPSHWPGASLYALIDACAFDDYYPCDQKGFKELTPPEGSDYRATCSDENAKPSAYAGEYDKAPVRCFSPSTGKAYSRCGIYQDQEHGSQYKRYNPIPGSEVMTYSEAYAFCENFEGDPCR